MTNIVGALVILKTEKNSGVTGKLTRKFIKGEGLRNAYKEEKAKIKKDIEHITSIHVVNCSKQTLPPEDFKLSSHNHRWCPYCAEERLFVYNENRELKECMVCSISESEYYTDKINYNLLK